MSKVRICDRCGTHIVGESGLMVFAKGYKYFRLDTESHFTCGSYDLCPSCKGKFDEFMKGDCNESNKSE